MQHLDEGTIHAWIDGELPPDEASRVEAHVKSVGPLEPFLHQLCGGLRAGMKYVGAATVEDLRTKAMFVRISGAGLRESHPHDVRITTEPPNYRIKA